MMDYELFKELIVKRVEEFLPPVFVNYRAEISTVRKVNEKKDTLLLIPGEHEDIAAMPNIYLDEMYEEFKECQDLEKILQTIAALVVHYTGRISAEELELDFNKKKDFIVMNLINTEKNQELLKTIPHKDVMDLSIIYRIIMGQEDHGMATVMVNNTIMTEMGITETELNELAYRNTAKMFPVEIFKLSELMYVMTNEAKIHGATTMMYKEAVNLLAEKIGGSFYIIPSSIHEVIAVPEKDANPKRLIKMLEEGNRVCGPKSEILSNSIYHYDKEAERFTVAASYYSQEEIAEA